MLQKKKKKYEKSTKIIQSVSRFFSILNENTNSHAIYTPRWLFTNAYYVCLSVRPPVCLTVFFLLFLIQFKCRQRWAAAALQSNIIFMYERMNERMNECMILIRYLSFILLIISSTINNRCLLTLPTIANN